MLHDTCRIEGSWRSEEPISLPEQLASAVIVDADHDNQRERRDPPPCT